ncbi:Conserved_hypothetical protein [Hexamita inflata]|uniref:Uncharacterized protein n=1 Tax=Hexamita inflata TaxID=28002 RepID=A0AA86PS31_9EUKA|nr:Conserved hypothetical protein [Hexamita inflata]CAI9950262.1 Conserved hypothetical protein [Hexamita inflata]
MRVLFVNNINASNIPAYIKKDISTQKYKDFIAIDMEIAIQSSKYAEQFKKPMSAAYTHKMQRMLIIEQLKKFKLQNSNMPSIGFPTQLTIVLLSGFTHFNQYSGELKLLNVSEKQQIQQEFQRELKLTCYYELEQVIDDQKQKKPQKQETIQPLQYIINEVAEQCPVQLAIIQQIMQEFVLRDIYNTVMIKSNIYNISGKTMRINLYPVVYTTPSDSQLVNLYDVTKIKQQQLSTYQYLMKDLKQDENELPVILGCMLDTVILTSVKQQVKPSQFDDDLLLSEEELLSNEQNLSQYQFRNEEGEITKEVSIFDTYSQLTKRYHSSQSRYYLKRVIDSILINQEEQQNPRTVMLRKSDFSELARMFMKDLNDKEITLQEAESVIRKTILGHMVEQKEEIILTEPVNMNIDHLELVKLGQPEFKKYNQLSVMAQLSQNYVPHVVTEKVNEMCNCKCITIEPQLKTECTDLSLAETKDQIELDLQRICRMLNIQFSPDMFKNFAPNYQEWIEQFLKLQILRERPDSKPQKKPEAGKQELIFKSEIVDAKEIEDLFEVVDAKNKDKDKKSKKVVNPFSPVYQSQVLQFIGYYVHRLFCVNQTARSPENKSPQKSPVQSSKSLEIKPSVQLDAQSVDKASRQIYSLQHLEELVKLCGELSCLQFGYTKQQQQQLKEKEKQDPKKQQQAELSPYQVLPIDLHAAFASFFVINFGDERMASGFNKIFSEVQELGESRNTIYFGKKANNVQFFKQSISSQAKSVLDDLYKNLPLLQQLNGFKNGKPNQVVPKSPLETNFRILDQPRNFGQFSIPICDRSIINAKRSQLKLYRCMSGFQISLEDQFSPQSELVDKLSLIENVTIPINAQTRPISPTKTDKNDKNAKPAVQVPDELQKVQLVRQQVDYDQLGFSNMYPSSSRFDANFLDGWRAVTVGQTIVFQKDQLQLTLGLDEKISISSGSNKCEIQGHSVKMLWGLKSHAIDNVFGLNAETFKPVPNFFSSAVISTCESAMLFQNLSSSSSDEIKIGYIQQEFNVFELVSVESKNFEPLIFESDEKLAYFNLNSIGVQIIFGSKCKLVHTSQNDTFIVKNNSVFAVKSDSSILSFFNVESSGKLPKVIERPVSPTVKGKKEVKPVEQPAEQPVQIFASPIILYGGPGHALYSSLLEKRSRYLRHCNINSRIAFDLQKKLKPTFSNPENQIKFEIQDPIELLFAMKDECVAQYKTLPAFSQQLQQQLAKKQNIQRLHNELFIPISDTQVSMLQGIYRFVLGGEALAESPLYPSISCYDWAGNTTHLRLGAPLQNKFEVQVQVQAQQQGKTKEVVYETVNQTIFAQDVTNPTVPPCNSSTVQTDTIAQINNLVEQREAEVLKFLEQQKRPKSTASEQTLKKPAKQQKAKEKPVEEPEPQLELKPREIEDILSELVKVEVKTPVALAIDGFVQQTHTLYPRQQDVVLNDVQLEKFVNNLNPAIPNPAQQISQTRYIVVPLAPEQKPVLGMQSHIENDAPWMAVNKKDLQGLRYYSSLAGFTQAPGTSFVEGAECAAFRFNEQIFRHFYISEPQLHSKITQLTSKIQKTYGDLKAKQNAGESTATYPKYMQVMKALNDTDVKLLQTLETTKEKSRKILAIRSQKMVQEEDEDLNQDLFQEVADIILSDKRNQLREKERVRQRQLEIELENQLQKERIVQQQNIKLGQDKMDDYYIDKPLKKPSSGKQYKPQSPKPNKIVPPEEDDSDEEFGVNTLKSQSFLKKHPYLKDVAQAEMPAILPKLTGYAKGQVKTKLIKVIPDKLNSKVQKNAVILKNMVDQTLSVTVEFPSQLIQVEMKEFDMKPFESKTVIVQHLRFGDAALKFVCSGENVQDVVKVEVFF